MNGYLEELNGPFTVYFLMYPSQGFDVSRLFLTISVFKVDLGRYNIYKSKVSLCFRSTLTFILVGVFLTPSPQVFR